MKKCSIQGQRQIVSKKPKGLQGKIFLSVEMPQDLSETYISRDRKVIKDTVREFSKLHPQVQVFVNFLPTETILNAFELQLERGAGPDLVLVYYSPKQYCSVRIICALAKEMREVLPFKTKNLVKSRSRVGLT